MRVICILCIVTGSFDHLKSQNRDIPFDRKFFPKEERDKLGEAVKNIKKGDKYYEYGSRATYIQALEYYLPANDFNPSNADLLFKIGNCYLNSLNKAKASFFLEKAFKLNAQISPEIKFMMGEANFFNQNIDSATVYYRSYLEELPKNADESIISRVKKCLETCDYAKKLICSPECYIIENLGNRVNTIFPEYAPVIVADESKMLFTSCRDNTLGGGRDPVDLFYYEDIYITPKSENDEWSVPVHPGRPLNSEYHDATVGLSPDGQRLLMYRGDNGGDLYESVLTPEGYGEPRKLPKPVNSPFHEPSACYTQDQNTLYFVSDRPGGYGGHDIYYCLFDKGRNRWGEAVNLGEVINTPQDEAGVFIHPDGKTLYFSSQGHMTMGGYDFFSSTLENGKWSRPRNLGYPVNTTDDDVFLVISADGRHGYFASYRLDGLGEKDIYRVTFTGVDKPLTDNNEDNLLSSIITPFRQASLLPPKMEGSSKLTLVKGAVYDALTRNPLNAVIEIHDIATNEVVNSVELSSNNGSYLVILPSGKNYGMTVRAKGSLYYSENFNIPQTQGYTEIIKDIYLENIEVGNKLTLRNIFFDFNSINMTSSSKRELDNLLLFLKAYPRLKVEVSAPWNRDGSVVPDQHLSYQRAESVAAYLKSSGIDPSRLSCRNRDKKQAEENTSVKEGGQYSQYTEVKILEK